MSRKWAELLSGGGGGRKKALLSANLGRRAYGKHEDMDTYTVCKDKEVEVKVWLITTSDGGGGKKPEGV